MWRPNRQDKSAPIYRQIADHLAGLIRGGEYPPGSFLPSERKLADTLEVNRTTVIQAYDELRAAGLVERSVGRGTKVTTPASGATGQSLNWRKYLDAGTFRPNLPAMRRIRSELLGSPDVIDFASGELHPELLPSEAIRTIMKEKAYDGPLGYSDPQGYGPLRAVLSAFLERYLDIRASEASLLVTSGSQQSLFLITQCLLDPGDAVAVEDPSYALSLPIFESAGLRAYPLRADPAGGIDPDDVAELHRRHRIRMIFVNPNYQNPTGTVLSIARKRRLLDVAAERGIPIVEDDPFSLTAFSGTVPPPLRSMSEGAQVLYVGSLSKIAASGLRVGWLAAPHSVIAKLTDARQQMDFGLSAVPQWLAAEWLGSPILDEHLERLRRSLARRLDLLRFALDAHLPGETEYRVPDGGLNLWVKRSRAAGGGDRLFESAIREGVAFVPGSVYGGDPSWLRLCFARPEEAQMEEGIARLAEALRRSRRA